LSLIGSWELGPYSAAGASDSRQPPALRDAHPVSQPRCGSGRQGAGQDRRVRGGLVRDRDRARVHRSRQRGWLADRRDPRARRHRPQLRGQA